MKIQEFRDIIKRCNRDEAEKIASEIYKLLPKNKKEEADAMIEDIVSGTATHKNQKVDVALDFDSLKEEINIFVNNVDNDLYMKPNRIVPKNKRSKWRFEVKNFIKMLNKVPADGENGEESAKLLRELYKRLAHGCGFYIFPSEDPFQSIGIRQPDFYEMLVKRTFATGFTDEKIKNMLEDAAFVNLDRNSLQIELESIYADSLTTSELKYRALSFIKEYVKQFESELNKDKNNLFDTNNYRIRSDIEELCETMLIISISLNEPEDAVKYYWEHVHDSNKEITLYKLLDTIRSFGDTELWIRVYEYGLENNIQPRESLKKQYQEFQR